MAHKQWLPGCGWVCVFCLALFLLAMCHFGGGETLQEAALRSSRSGLAQSRKLVPGSGNVQM